MNLKDLNLFSWANDSWKSNIFRTLNIFFNNEVSFWNPFDINKDFSRSLELKTQKVIDISIDFNQWKESTYLPKEFTIKKIYYRDNSFKYNYLFKNKAWWKNMIISSLPEENAKNKAITSKDEKNYRTQFSKFLWNFIFDYVPAIRDQKYFSNLFWKVILKLKKAEVEKKFKIDKDLEIFYHYKKSIKKYEKWIKVRNSKISTELSKKLEWWIFNLNDIKRWVREIKDYRFKVHILCDDDSRKKEILKLKREENKISDFSRGIRTFSNTLNKLSRWLFSEISFLNSEFTIQDNLLDFFETFEIWTGDSKDISLKFRWDWMQAKFIPHILDFLSKKQILKDDWSFDWEYDKKINYIWWFEEPENSYEYSNSIRLANNFVWIKNKKKDELWRYIKNSSWEYLYEDINYSKNKQIFITTHSEEFLRLFLEDSVKSDVWMYLVAKKENKRLWYIYSSVEEIKKESFLKSVYSDLWLRNIARSKLVFDLKIKMHENQDFKDKIEAMLIENQLLNDEKEQMLKESEELINKIEDLNSQEKEVILCENTDSKILNKLWFKGVEFWPFRDKNTVCYHSISLWKKGLIDKDYLLQSEKDYIEESTEIRVLSYYSIESYLYHPNNLLEYYTNKWLDFNIWLYMEDILEEYKKSVFNPVTIVDWRKSYWEVKNILNVHWVKNPKELMYLFNETDFEKIYEYIPMKDSCTEIAWRKNIHPRDLSSTAWFRSQMSKCLGL